MANLFEGYKITSPYGNRKDPFGSGKMVFHTGIDLVKSHKAPINAFVEGIVTHAKLGVAGSGLGGYGNVVCLKDKGNRLHLYAHLDSISVKVGAVVKKGQTVGKQGTTGNSTGSHLHYEVRKTASPSFGFAANGTLNPTDYLNSLTPPKPIVKPIVKPVVKPKKKYVVLPSTSPSWNVYPLTKAPVKANAIGQLNPKKFKGLTYEILANPQDDVYTIQTTSFGKVNIYAAKSTGAKIVEK